MTIRLSAKAALVGTALYAMATGILLLVLKGPVVLPTVAWLRSLTASELDTYMSIVGRASIAIGAVTLLAVILLTHVRRAGERREPKTERE